MKKELIVDTSIFVNPASSRQFGGSPAESLIEFLKMVERNPAVCVYMPPSIYSELMHFIDEKLIPKNLLLLIKQQPPKKHEIKVPGVFIYDLVEEMRGRIDRGLRLAERHVREAIQAKPADLIPEENNSKKIQPDFESISRLRETYRRIMREQMLDSKADVDLLLLAYEIGGTLVSADDGVVLWAEKFGIECLPFDRLGTLLSEFIKNP
jgi:RNA ligase partner protein